MNCYETGRHKAGDTCHTCGAPMVAGNDNLYLDSRGVRHCRACGRRAAEKSRERRELGLPPLRNRAGRMKAEAPKTITRVFFDHSKCTPRDPNSLCEECTELYREAQRATA